MSSTKRVSWGDTEGRLRECQVPGNTQVIFLGKPCPHEGCRGVVDYVCARQGGAYGCTDHGIQPLPTPAALADYGGLGYTDSRGFRTYPLEGLVVFQAGSSGRVPGVLVAEVAREPGGGL